MSAYVVVELVVKDAAAKDRYSAAAGATIKDHGGEFVAGGGWTTLVGDSGLGNGAIIRFPDRESALAWYNSSAYQATLADRDAGIDCRFRLIGK